MIPQAVLIDFGGTLMAETGFDLRAGNEWLLSRASSAPPELDLEAVTIRASEIGRLVIARREETHIEIPWPAVARLIYAQWEVEFEDAFSDLELGFWRASVRTTPLPNVRETLDRLSAAGIPMAIVSNTSFSEHTLRDELARHELDRYFAFIMTSADFSIRKPNPLLFDIAARRIGAPPAEIWFVGDRLQTDVAGANAAGMTSVLLGTPPDRANDARPAITLSAWHEWTGVRQFEV